MKNSRRLRDRLVYESVKPLAAKSPRGLIRYRTPTGVDWSIMHLHSTYIIPAHWIWGLHAHAHFVKSSDPCSSIGALSIRSSALHSLVSSVWRTRSIAHLMPEWEEQRPSRVLLRMGEYLNNTFFLVGADNQNSGFQNVSRCLQCYVITYKYKIERSRLRKTVLDQAVTHWAVWTEDCFILLPQVLSLAIWETYVW